jgi:hypothetical protein
VAAGDVIREEEGARAVLTVATADRWRPDRRCPWRPSHGDEAVGRTMNLGAPHSGRHGWGDLDSRKKEVRCSVTLIGNVTRQRSGAAPRRAGQSRGTRRSGSSSVRGTRGASRRSELRFSLQLSVVIRAVGARG